MAADVAAAGAPLELGFGHEDILEEEGAPPSRPESPARVVNHEIRHAADPLDAAPAEVGENRRLTPQLSGLAARQGGGGGGSQRPSRTGGASEVSG